VVIEISDGIHRSYMSGVHIVLGNLGIHAMGLTSLCRQMSDH